MEVKFKLKDTGAMDRILRAATNDISESILKEMGRLIVEEIQKNINLWYGTYTPILYDRTEDTLRAIKIFKIVDTSSMKYVEVFFDMNEVSSVTHEIAGTSQADLFPYIIEKGWTMPNGVPRQGAHAFEIVYNELDDGALKVKIYEFLKVNGYDVTFK